MTENGQSIYFLYISNLIIFKLIIQLKIKSALGIGALFELLLKIPKNFK